MKHLDKKSLVKGGGYPQFRSNVKINVDNSLVDKNVNLEELIAKKKRDKRD